MFAKTRIITNGTRFKVQYRKFLIFWITCQRPGNDAEKDFGGDAYFDTIEEAKEYINRNFKEEDWEVVEEVPRISSLDTM